MGSTKLVETAKKVLELPDTLDSHVYMRKFQGSLDTISPDFMQSVQESPNTCGTSFCIAGWLAAYDGFPKEHRDYSEIDKRNFHFKYIDYSETLTGQDSEDLEWKFLFFDYWPNSLKAAKKRAKHLIDNGGVAPPIETWLKEFDFTSSYGLAKLRERNI